MPQPLDEVVELLQLLEPAHDPLDTVVRVQGCGNPDYPEHCHLVNYDHDADESDPTPQKVTLRELFSLNILDPRRHLREENVNVYLHAVLDEALAVAASDLYSLRDMTPLENDAEKILTGIVDKSSLQQLVMEYIRYEEDVYETLSQMARFVEGDPYTACLESEMNRVVSDMKQLRDLTVRSTKATGILKGYAADCGVDAVDDEPMSVAVHGPMGMWGHDLCSCDHDLAIAIMILNNSIDDLYGCNLLEMPRWMVNLLQATSAALLASTPLPVREIDPIIFDTAKILWAEGGTYDNFDVAYRTSSILIRS